MKRVLAMIILVAGCQQDPPSAKTDLETKPEIKTETETETKADLKTLSGVVIERRANVKSYEAWNAPSDPYYVLDIGKVDEQYSKHMRVGFQKDKHQVTLRPSGDVTAVDIGRFKDKRVVIAAEYTDGERYEPKGGEEWPYEIETVIAPDGSKEERPIPAKRGRGYIVYSINEREE